MKYDFASSRVCNHIHRCVIVGNTVANIAIRFHQVSLCSMRCRDCRSVASVSKSLQSDAIKFKEVHYFAAVCDGFQGAVGLHDVYQCARTPQDWIRLTGCSTVQN